MKTVNPATGEIIKEYVEFDSEKIENIINKANDAQKRWATKSYDDRAKIVKKAAKLLLQNKEELARLMSLEMGKTLKESVSEIEKCAWVCEYYAENAAKFLADEMVETSATKSYVTFKPLGIVLSIMPWNFPYWQLFRFGAPALMAGNGVVLKHSENTTGCALKIEEILHDAGIPKDLFRTLVVSNKNMEPVIKNSGIAAVTLTGSTRAGKIVAQQAASTLKKSVLELGGSDPYIILEDADLDNAAEQCANSRLINNGQSCIAAKRFIVVDKVYNQFVEKFTARMKSKKMGDPFEENTDVGPMARADLRDELHNQVQESVKLGAKLSLGGFIPERKGAFYPPTILENITAEMPAYSEELFGPVAAIIKVKDEEEAIKVANDSIYGLGAAIFSNDVERANNLAANKLEAGCCFINEFVKSDPRLPFGGVKNSGYGRELGKYGIMEFVNIKTVYIH